MRADQQNDSRYADRLFIAAIRCPLSKPIAQRAVQTATRLLALALGESLRELRSSNDPLMRAHSASQEHAVLARTLAEVAEILGARWDRLPDQRRPHYTPHQRWRILEIKRLLALSADEAATLFRVATATIQRWDVEAGREPAKNTIGALLRPTPPLRRYADVVRAVVQRMDRLGFPSAEKIAATLARAGWRLARETVRRYRHHPPVEPRPSGSRVRALRGPIEARAPHHVWLADLTYLRGLFGLTIFRIVAVFDAFSRMPLAVRVFGSEPTSAEVANLMASAIRRHGRPRLLVTDHGTQFIADSFETKLRRLRVEHRVGAVGLSGSLALLERYWRTLTESLRLPLFGPLTLGDLERRVAYAVLHYAYYRPHQALHGATPAELLHGWPPAGDDAAPPPRGARGQGGLASPFRVVYLDPEGRHPILIKAA